MKEYFTQKSCNISIKQISNLLYAYSENYRKDVLIATAKDSKKLNPRKEINKARDICVEYNRCHNGTIEERTDPFNSCVPKIIDLYNNFFETVSSTQEIDNNNVGKEKYWNDNIEDSPYDIVYDFNTINKILYESFDKQEKISFYDLPDNNGKVKEDNKSNSSENQKQNSDSSPQNTNNNQTPSQKVNSNSSNTNNSSQTTPNEDKKTEEVTSRGKEIKDTENNADDQNVQENKKTGTTSLKKNDFWGSTCVTIPQDAIIDETLTEQEKISTILSDFFEEPQNEPSIESTSELWESTVNNGVSNENPTNQWYKTGNEILSTNIKLDNQNNKKNAVQEINNCYKQCEKYQSWSVKLNCKARCACNKRESPFYQENKKSIDIIGIQLWPIASIEFCTVPASTSASTNMKGGKMYSIEEIFNEMKQVLEMLNNSWELWIHEKKREFFDSEAKTENFSQSMAIEINSETSPNNTTQTNTPSRTIEAQNQQANLKDINKYLVVQTTLSKNNEYSDTTYNEEEIDQNSNALYLTNKINASQEEWTNQNTIFIDQQNDSLIWMTQSMKTFIENFSETIEYLNRSS